jgi:plastocyanin
MTALALVLAALAGPAPADRVVLVDDYAFKPARVVVRRGDLVEWRFRDGGVAHNATGRAIRSGDRRRGEYRKRFRTRGTYSYVCTFHPSMRGRVVVR